jgi:hypothetical protein
VERTHFTDKVRIQLLEKDADDIDVSMAAMNDKLGKILWAVVGVLISVTTSAILLAINLGVAR